MISKQLLDFIVSQKQGGIKDDEIKAKLIAKGWQKSVVDEAFYISSNTPINIAQISQSKIAPESRSPFKIVVKVLNIIIGLYFISHAVLFSFGIIITLPFFIIKGNIGLGVIQNWVITVLVIIACFKFLKDKNRYTHPLYILIFIIVAQLAISLIVSHKFDWVDFSNTLFYGIPAVFIFITRFIKEKYV